MWSSKAGLRAALLAAALATSAALSACTSFTPVYGERGVATTAGDFRFAPPQNRLDQIIYQNLLLTLGQSKSSSAPLVEIATTAASTDLTRSAVERPNDQRQAVVTATIRITNAAGKLVFNTTRSAAAVYTVDSQGLANSEAQKDAEARAASVLAETVRLTLLSSTGLKGT